MCRDKKGYLEDLNMPIYEFHCGDCGKIFEKFFSIHNIPEIVECEKCGSPARRFISAVNTNFGRHQETKRALIADFFDEPVDKFPHKTQREI